MSISFSGLATGIDTESLVQQLVDVELQSARVLEQRKTNANRRQSIISDLVTRLQALKSAAAALDTPNEVRSLTAHSSDEARIKVTSSGAAQPANLSLRVGTLARAQTSVSTLFPASGDEIPTVPGAGQLGITVGSGEEVVVEFTSLDSLQDVANRINEQVTGAHAELIDTGNGFQLAVSSQETGTANALTFTEAGSSLGFLAEDSAVVDAQDATFTMNGIAITRSSNTVGDLLTGVTLELLATHAPADADTSVTVTANPSGTEAKVKSLVDAFNALADAVGAQTSYNGVTRGQDTLFGDSTVRALQRSLSQMAGMSFPHGEGDISLNDVGIQLARTGRLTIDSAALAEALGDDPAALENLIAGPAGLASAMTDMVTQYTRAGDGFLSAKSSSLTREMSDYDLQIERIETRASKVGDQLRAQFTALEALMSNFQSQQASLAMLFQ